MTKMVITSLLLLIFNCSSVICQQKISIASKPQKIYIETAENKQIINADFLVANNTADTLTLTKLVVNVFDKNHKLIHSKFIDNNGTAPGIFIIQNRKFNGRVSQLIFNPFTDFSITLPIATMKFEWTFFDEADNETKINTTISPVKYVQRSLFTFPLRAKVLVYDAHDFFSHHRRFDYEFAPIKALGIEANFMRYAYDFVVLDAKNNQFRRAGKDEDYVGYGQPVYSIGGGKIIYASNKHKDDKTFDVPKLATNPLELYGNCLAILHADNSVSVYGHLKQNTISVKEGETVRPKQKIGKIGISGSSFFPHLHFELRTSTKSSAEGLPSYFSNVFLVEGSNKMKIKSGFVETGNIIEAKY